MESSDPSRAGGGFWSSEKLRHDLDTVGYTVIRSHFAPAEIQRLLSSARKLTSAARDGAWPHLRTLPKQFPPWTSNAADGIWGVQHLLHPDLATGPDAILTAQEAAAFTELYFGDAVIGPVKAILGLPRGPSGDDALMMELFNMLVAPPTPFALRWHRDDVSFSLSPEEEARALGVLQYSQAPDTPSPQLPQSQIPSTQIKEPPPPRRTHTQYNIPLLPDTSLHLLPSSHLRPRTPTEISLLHHNPHSDALPGWIPLPLHPGDICFYDNNLIHRGVYAGGETQGERYTLHGSVGRADGGGGVGRARGVLQHGVGGWVGRIDVGEGKQGGRGDDHGAGGISAQEDPERACTPATPVQAPVATVPTEADEAVKKAAHGVMPDGHRATGPRPQPAGESRNKGGGEVNDLGIAADAQRRVLRRRAETMRRRLLALGAQSGDVGFVHGD